MVFLSTPSIASTSHFPWPGASVAVSTKAAEQLGDGGPTSKPRFDFIRCGVAHFQPVSAVTTTASHFGHVLGREKGVCMHVSLVARSYVSCKTPKSDYINITLLKV